MSKLDSEPRTYSGLRPETVLSAARAAHGQLPDTHGFMLLIVPFGDGSGNAQADYVSNCNREDAIKALKETLFRWGVNEEWMKEAK